MRTLLFLLTVIALLATSGCSMFSGGRNNANDRDHPGSGNNDYPASGMQHSEHPDALKQSNSQ
jgi:hypothetical protein